MYKFLLKNCRIIQNILKFFKQSLASSVGNPLLATRTCAVAILNKLCPLNVEGDDNKRQWFMLPFLQM